VEGLEPPTHGLEIENVPYPLFGISKLASSLKARTCLSETSMHHRMHQPD
jgi:hypothetical protein